MLFGVIVTGHVSPLFLLTMTFAFSAGDAFESPAWRAALPELVSKDDLAPASALNGIEFNFARAIGPALGGVLIAIAGISTAFLVNAVSNSRGHLCPRPMEAPDPQTHHASRDLDRRDSCRNPIRPLLTHASRSPVAVRIVMFFASGLLAFLPSVAQSANK